MTKGEKLFIGTIAGLTLSGAPAGYMVGAELNNATQADIANAEAALATADARVDNAVDSLSTCGGTVVMTMVELDYSDYRLPETAKELMDSLCADDPVSEEALAHFKEAYDKRNEASYALTDTIDDSKYTASEITSAVLTGLGCGWIAGWGSVMGGAVAKDKLDDFVKRRKEKAKK